MTAREWFWEIKSESWRWDVEVITYPFQSERIKGLYIDGTITLNENLSTTSEKACILAEELGHYYTASGNILDQQENRKQELRTTVGF